MPHLDIFDFIEHNRELFDMWEYLENTATAIRISKYILKYYKLDYYLYDCNKHEEVRLRRIKRNIIQIVQYRWNILETFKQIMNDIVLLSSYRICG